ncbi:hypothetical protein [Segniliparus rugosus]|uniref:Cell division protein FtsL n=1 Tax=Segniliparus rugosus (strain ATCC BAA-974 / DSM 45345 / CCUG 50838 / CIP 108380 / JCM 13579 / CDC 945) TaxID=679197 RepID=E5XMP9_SEGRC|nr:hypothetical protein [Segniliparus rugosus]EFV14394.1 hypothetical protein HMPREF9336_00769 [Segniliparus rugosus ATCC BAA-974]
MRGGVKQGPTATRQRSKAAARALRRRDMRMGQASERRPHVESSRRPVSRGPTKGFMRSGLPPLPDREKLWWMIAFPSRELLRRVPFVIGVIGLLAVGLAATLWLATRSTEDASTLSAMRLHNRELQQEKERLERDMERGQSVTELARRAGDLGMVPAQDVAKLVPQPDGSVQVVGQLKPAEGGPERPLEAGAGNPGEPAKPQPPAPAPGEAPAPAQPDNSVERVHPTQVVPEAPAPDGAPGQPPAEAAALPPVSSLPPADPVPASPPADPAPSLSQAVDQAPLAPSAPPAQEDNPAPPAPEAPEQVASQPAAPVPPKNMEQPEQEQHE